MSALLVILLFFISVFVALSAAFSLLSTVINYKKIVASGLKPLVWFASSGLYALGVLIMVYIPCVAVGFIFAFFQGGFESLYGNVFFTSDFADQARVTVQTLCAVVCAVLVPGFLNKVWPLAQYRHALIGEGKV